MQYSKWLAAILAALMLYLPADIEARESRFEGGSEEIEDSPAQTKEVGEHAWDESEPYADDWFTNPDKREDYGSDDKTSGDEEEKKKKERFVEIYRDESFIYSMDKKTAHYTRIPHSIDEKMIDVWVKLESLEYAPEDYSYLRQLMDPIFQMSEHNLTEDEIRSISLALARVAYRGAREGVDIFESLQFLVLPLEATNEYDIIAGTKGHLIDKEANTAAIKEFLGQEE